MGAHNWSLEDRQKFVTTKASLLCRGLIFEDDEGVRLTESGYRVAYDRWLQLPDGDKLLYAFLVKKLLKMHQI